MPSLKTIGSRSRVAFLAGTFALSSMTHLTLTVQHVRGVVPEMSLTALVGTTEAETARERAKRLSKSRREAARSHTPHGVKSVTRVRPPRLKHIVVEEPVERPVKSVVPEKARCGDKLILESMKEECDDGNALKGDGCSDLCKIETGYECSGVPSACIFFCGDGKVADPHEKCDDGNRESGDGCSADCKYIELGYACSGSPSVCKPK